MKTCKNCGTINKVTEVKCGACNMEGHFTLHTAPTAEVVETLEYDTVECCNCGSHQSVEASKCTQCRFPLTEATTKPISKLTNLNRKVG